jgi:hypothetical protein
MTNSQKLYKQHREEVSYWIDEFSGPLNFHHIAVVEVDECEKHTSIVFAHDDKTALVIETLLDCDDPTKATKWMMIENPIIDAIIKLMQQKNVTASDGD